MDEAHWRIYTCRASVIGMCSDAVTRSSAVGLWCSEAIVSKLLIIFELEFSTWRPIWQWSITRNSDLAYVWVQPLATFPWWDLNHLLSVLQYPGCPLLIPLPLSIPDDGLGTSMERVSVGHMPPKHLRWGHGSSPMRRQPHNLVEASLPSTSWHSCCNAPGWE